jgi:ribose 5-phosphate isomerase B
MKIAIGADHGGFELKKGIKDFLKKKKYQIKDFGTSSSKSCDYPLIGYKVASCVASGEFDRGILICKSGLGMCMVSNKVPGIRAARLCNVESAHSSRKHNDANIAVFSGKSIGIGKVRKILEVWLTTPFAGGRHARRIRQIKGIEEKILKGKL